MKHYDIKKHLFVFLFLLIGTFTVASGQVKSSVSEDTNNSAVTEENLYNALVKKLDAAKVPYNKTALRQTIRQRLASKEIPSPFFKINDRLFAATIEKDSSDTPSAEKPDERNIFERFIEWVFGDLKTAHDQANARENEMREFEKRQNNSGGGVAPSGKPEKDPNDSHTHDHN